jgi:hypothetical protein
MASSSMSDFAAAGPLSAMQQYEHFRENFASPLATPQRSPQVAY